MQGSMKSPQKPQTVADQIADVLREAIVRGSLIAGTALRQDELAERFGFSRMPIRDALRQLESEGIVSIHPTKGAQVAAMDATEIRDIYALRELLECEALRLSIPHLDRERLDDAETTLRKIDAEPDVGKWGSLNQSFHLLLYSRCGNERLLKVIEAHHKAADRYVRILLSRLDYTDRSQTEHRDLLVACRKKSTDRAVKILKRHLREGSATLVGAVRGRSA